MNYAFLAAGGVSAFGFVLTLILGRRPPPSRDAADPLSLSDTRFARFAGLALLAAMTLIYADASRRTLRADTVLAISLLALVLVVGRIVFALRARARHLDIGEWGFPALAAALGLAGSDLQRWIPA